MPTAILAPPMNNYPSFSDVIEKSLHEHLKRKDAFFENVIRTHAVPPVKGEITPCKIKWRGIQRCFQVEGARTREWLEQRGKPIGGVFYEGPEESPTMTILHGKTIFEHLIPVGIELPNDALKGIIIPTA